MAVRSNNLETAELIISEINLKILLLLITVVLWWHVERKYSYDRSLLKYGADINAQGDGSTPLTGLNVFAFLEG